MKDYIESKIKHRSSDSPMIHNSKMIISKTRFPSDDWFISFIKKHLGYYAIQQMKMIFEKTPKKYADNLFIFPAPAPEILCKIKTIFQLTTTLSLSKITRNKIYI